MPFVATGLEQKGLGSGVPMFQKEGPETPTFH